MAKNCNNCKYKKILKNDEWPCSHCIIYDLWEHEEPQGRATIQWRPVSDPPKEPMLVLISFQVVSKNVLVSEGHYEPGTNRRCLSEYGAPVTTVGYWDVFDADMKDLEPAFYIPIKDLSIPQTTEKQGEKH